MDFEIYSDIFLKIFFDKLKLKYKFNDITTKISRIKIAIIEFSVLNSRHW